MVDHLLASRVSVLDIGRVELGDLPDAVATTESYRGVLDLGNTDQMMVEAEVYINDVKQVSIGAPARVRGDGFVVGAFGGSPAPLPARSIPPVPRSVTAAAPRRFRQPARRSTSFQF